MKLELTLGDGADFEVGFGLRGRDNTRRLKFTLECWGWLEKRGRTSEVGVDVGLGADPAGWGLTMEGRGWL